MAVSLATINRRSSPHASPHATQIEPPNHRQPHEYEVSRCIATKAVCEALPLHLAQTTVRMHRLKLVSPQSVQSRQWASEITWVLAGFGWLGGQGRRELNLLQTRAALSEADRAGDTSRDVTWYWWEGGDLIDYCVICCACEVSTRASYRLRAGVFGCFPFFICFLGGGGSSEADAPGQREYQ